MIPALDQHIAHAHLTEGYHGIPELKSGHCTSGHCASGQLSLTWFLSLDGWVPMSLLHPVHQPPHWAGYFPQSVHQPNPTASVSQTGAVRFLATVLLKSS